MLKPNFVQDSPMQSKQIMLLCYTVYPKKYAHGFVVLCLVVVMQSFKMNSHEVFIHIHQGCFAGNEAIVRLPQCQWSKPDGYGKISQCITTTKHSRAKTVCIFLRIYCTAILTRIIPNWTLPGRSPPRQSSPRILPNQTSPTKSIPTAMRSFHIGQCTDDCVM